MPRVIHFEITVDAPERTAQFYSNVFGWKIDKWTGPEDYWLITTGDSAARGIDGALMRRGVPPLNQAVINTLDVASVDDFVTRIEQHGGKVIAPKMPIPGVGYFAYCQDPEGNVFGIMQEDASVAA